MQLNFTYQKKEWISGFRAYQFLMKRITKVQLIVMGLLPLLFVAMFLSIGMRSTTIIVLASAVLIYVMTGFILFIQPQLIYNSTSKYRQSYQLTFSEENICFKTQEIESRLSWDIYNGYLENEKFFYLLQQKNMYTLIPKRAFETQEQITAFKGLLGEKLNKAFC